MSTALAIQQDQTTWTQQQEVALQSIGVENPTAAELSMFLHQCQRTGLDPFARQIHMVRREGRQVIQTGIDGYRLIARRTVERSGEALGYQPTQWCGPDGRWVDVWLDPEHPPAAARVVVVRAGQEFDAVALFDSYAGRRRDGKLNRMWSTQGPLMIAKCAEALALRKAFPQDLGGLYIAEEHHNNDQRPEQQTHAAAPPQQQAMTAEAADELRQQVEAASTLDELQDLWEAGAAQGAPAEIAALISQRASALTQGDNQ